MSSIADLSHRVGALLRGPKPLDQEGIEEQVKECMILCSEIAEHLDNYRMGDLMIDTLRGWIGRCQMHVGLQSDQTGVDYV